MSLDPSYDELMSMSDDDFGKWHSRLVDENNITMLESQLALIRKAIARHLQCHDAWMEKNRPLRQRLEARLAQCENIVSKDIVRKALDANLEQERQSETIPVDLQTTLNTLQSNLYAIERKPKLSAEMRELIKIAFEDRRDIAEQEQHTYTFGSTTYYL